MSSELYRRIERELPCLRKDLTMAQAGQDMIVDFLRMWEDILCDEAHEAVGGVVPMTLEDLNRISTCKRFAECLSTFTETSAVGGLVLDLEEEQEQRMKAVHASVEAASSAAGDGKQGAVEGRCC